jgi:1-acyl-sn-glycerol-3-phosphate acyltransferase
VANHQGAFDIFLVYGFLGRNFKWMMKYQLNKIPFVGYACRKSHQIFVDKRGVGKVRQTYEAARHILETGNCSVVVFPEGARSFTGHMGAFKKGAFALADELQLPVVPLTINGSFDVMPRMKDWHFATWHPLSLTIHQPVYPIGQGTQNIQATMNQAYDSVMSALDPQYQGFVENPDQ